MSGKADTVPHLSRESWLPEMSVSNCPFPNKEETVWTMTSLNTQHTLDEKLTQSQSVVFGTKSEIIRPYIFTVFHSYHPTWASQHPDAIARDGMVIPIVKMQMEKLRELC